MAKQVIIRCICDACGKETSERYLVKFGKGSWNNDEEMDVMESRDLCRDCYDQLIDLIDAGKGKDICKPKTEPEPITKRSTKRVEIDDKFIEAFEDGVPYSIIAKEWNLTRGQMNSRVRRLKKEGHVRGITKKMGNPDSQKRGMVTTVDENGFVISIN